MTTALNTIAIEDFGPAFETVMEMTRFNTFLHSMFMVVKNDRGLDWYNGPGDARLVAQNLYFELYGLRAANKLTDSKYSISSGYLGLVAENSNGDLRMSLSFNMPLGFGYSG
jgi:hypothetical protein